VFEKGEEKRLVHTVCACTNFKTNLWKIEYSGNLPCNSDVTSLKFLLPQVGFSIMVSTTFRGSTFSDAVSYALKQLQMSHFCLKPEQRSSMKVIYDGNNDFMWLPTGYGKSLCFHALPFLMDFKRRSCTKPTNSTTAWTSHW